MQVKHVEILNKENLTLRGYLTMPYEFNGSLVVMYHGFTGNKTETGGVYKTFSRIIAASGFASLRMDFSSNGESDGEFDTFNFDTLIDDALLIFDYAKELRDVNEIIVLGYSMSGAVASLILKERLEDIAGLMLWSPAGNIKEIIANAYLNSPKLLNGNADYSGWEISKDLYETSQRYDVIENLKLYNKPSLVIHGSKDLAVDYSWGKRFSDELGSSRFVLIDGAPHGYNKVEYRQMLFNESLKYLKRINEQNEEV